MSTTATNLNAPAFDLVQLGKVRSGTQTGAIRTSEGLESQLAYLQQTRKDHGYSKAVETLFDLVLSYIDDAEAAARNGRKAAWVGAMAWAPIFYAADTIPISVPEVGRLGSNDAMAVAEDYFQLPKESCSMVGAVLGEFYLRMSRTVKRIAVYNAVCEPLNVGWELLRAEGFDVFRVEGANRPNLADNPDRVAQIERFLAEELAELGIWLTGGTISETRIAEEIKRSNRLLGKLRQILHLRSANPLYVRSLATMYLLMGSGHYFGKPEQFEEVLDRLIDELQSADVITSNRPLVRLAWVDVWTRDIPEDRPPLDAIAHHIVSNLGAGSPTLRLKRIEESLPVFGATGILLYGYVGCSFGGIHREIRGDYFQKHGYPSLALEGSFQVGPPTGQLQTRIRAFIEMLSR